MFLDYDGTLSPIVDDPDRAIMSDNVRTNTMFLLLDMYSPFSLFTSENLFCRCGLLCEMLQIIFQQQL